MSNLWQAVTRNAAAIQAVCSILIVIIAVVAAFIALRQLAAGYRIHREQAQPYVAVGMRTLDEVDSHFIEFFVRNFGQTAANDVRVTSEPPLHTAWRDGRSEPMWMFDVLPTLVPGDEWTQMLGFAPAHFQGDLPMRYDVTVEWKDSNGKEFTAAYILDWEAHRDRRSVSKKTVHHLAKTAAESDKKLAEISKALQRIADR